MVIWLLSWLLTVDLYDFSDSSFTLVLCDGRISFFVIDALMVDTVRLPRGLKIG